MERLTRWIARLTIRDWEQVTDPRVRSAYGMLEGWVSIVGNLVLSVIKGVLGVALHSSGLIADAVHSLSDMASSVVVILSFRMSNKPPDPEHPYGHAKAEYIATLVVSLLMIVAGLQIGQEAGLGLWHGAPPSAEVLTWPLFFVLVVLLLAKEGMGMFSRVLGRMIRSDALAADAWHHRTDALSTAVVIVGLWGRNWGLPWLDGVAGLIVALWIVYAGGKMAYDAVSPLLGETVEPEELDELRSIAQNVPGVVNTHDIKVHRYGHFYFTTLHCELSDRMDVHHMHEVTAVIETRILKRYPGECVVHMDPVNLFHPLLHHVSDVLRDAVVAHPRLVEFRDLNLTGGDGTERGDVEVSVQPDTPDEEYTQISDYLTAEVRRQFPTLDFSVRLKVDFSAAPMQPHGLP